MKKIIALVLCIAFVCTLSVVAFAASPTAETKYTVTMRKGTGVEGVTANDTATPVSEDDTVVVTPDSSNGEFKEWTVFKKNPDGSTSPAVAGTDYELVDGSTLGSTTLKIKPKADIVVCGNYNGTTTDPNANSSAPGQYKIIKGADSKWKKGSGTDLLIASDAPFAKFSKVTLDGAVIDPANYTAAEGSTEITLKASYLESLATKTYAFTIVSTDGEASTTLTVTTDGSTSPATGESSNSMSILVAVMLAAAAAFCFSARKVYSK